ncbi:2-C-methyl-D-erythritol 4-phosphate cytidylyltransferase [Marinilabilia salmonicolor]|uniref:2-C-methyl-D-erythritol 4-phosphate cytidylyltransferase n=1 Tax=Marinilabilia salmonicolor TaxID=989 RepID=UPI00029A3AA1|nr:2-C-methyl-D-erythritol 4-phosphate cytidylyltransferase [Marinilabilia salmonicolor]
MLERSVIIVAGGRGLRMGQDIPKQFIPVGGRPVLMHTMEQFYGYNESMEIILVLPEDQFSYWKALCRKYDFQVRHQLIRGGETRYHSVKNGLDAVSGQMVAVHDGVRPFVTPETIERCFHTAQKYGAVIPVVELVDSIRKVDGNNSEMRPRYAYRSIQTPQVFRTSVLKKAYELPFSPDFTDDASVVEAAGYEITLVEGNRENVKITTPFDLVVAEAFLKGR